MDGSERAISFPSSTIGDFAAALERFGKSLRLTPDRMRALMRWARGEGELDALADESESRLGLVVQSMYAASAVAIGPIAADRVLARAAQVAEARPEAQKFAPRRLL